MIVKPTPWETRNLGVPSSAEFMIEPKDSWDDVAQEIIIVGTGNATYYNVVIESVNDWDVSLSAQVNGSYDTIDISSLPADEYCITITTAWNDTFVGYFEIE